MIDVFPFDAIHRLLRVQTAGQLKAMAAERWKTLRSSSRGTEGAGIRPTGAVSGNIIRILPPLILKRQEADDALAILSEAISYAQRTVKPKAVATMAWM
ncbi:MAG TPA: hypothetical protein VHX12_01970 [Acidisoma sp.]|nr:hypothetical protein [Acidisoma sp.]